MSINHIHRPPFVCSIRRGQWGVNVFSVSDQCLALCTKDSLARLMPEYVCNEVLARTPYEIWHINDKKVFAEHRLQKKQIIVGGSKEDLGQGDTIPFLAYGFLERQGQANKEATIHGAGLSFGESGIVILGKEGSG